MNVRVLGCWGRRSQSLPLLERNSVVGRRERVAEISPCNPLPQQTPNWLRTSDPRCPPRPPRSTARRRRRILVGSVSGPRSPNWRRGSYPSLLRAAGVCHAHVPTCLGARRVRVVPPTRVSEGPGRAGHHDNHIADLRRGGASSGAPKRAISQVTAAGGRP